MAKQTTMVVIGSLRVKPNKLMETFYGGLIPSNTNCSEDKKILKE